MGGQAVKITADTNVLIRAILDEDPKQSPVAIATLRTAEVVAIPTPVLCEFVWVLARGYAVPLADIGDSIRTLINSTNVAVNRPAVEAGLAFLDAGGDFADGAISFEGKRLGGETFVSFDKDAVKLLEKQGHSARLLQ